MTSEKFALLRELRMDDVLMFFYSPAERRLIQELEREGLVERRGWVFRRAVITDLGMDVSTMD